jgi:transcriptional regulator GlxA family with amidase domain
MTSTPEFRPSAKSEHRVVFAAFDGISALDLSGPLSVFAGATYFLQAKNKPGYESVIVSLRGGNVASDLGAALVTRPASEVENESIDTLMVPGALDMSAGLADTQLVAWIGQHGQRARRVCSVCAGALLIAEAGLANGRRLATHWAHCVALQKGYPEVQVEPDPIYIQDGPIWSSAGVTAGIDLALALVEEDYGRELAMMVARQHVVYLRRSGGQSQFSPLLEEQAKGKETFAKLHEWMLDRLGDTELTVERLAERARMSPRNFSRVYTETTGRTPAKSLELFRVEAARRLLESTAAPIEAIAHRTGFGAAERMRTVFQRRLKVSPRDYRERFGMID